MNTARSLVTSLATSLLLAYTATTHAANFGVSPLSLDLTTQQRSAVITVSNDDSKVIQLKVHAMRWTQNEAGEDQYQPTDDLVFFPKRLEIKPGEQRIIRTGLPATPLTGNERAYRLFVEELPPVELPTDGQTKLSVLLSFALPVFVAPAVSTSKLDISSAELSRDGTLSVKLANVGQTRARISRVISDDGKLASESVSSRYVFPTVAKTITAKLGADACKQSPKNLKLELDNQMVNVSINRSACAS
jgi:fimbrial chaperone protein